MAGQLTRRESSPIESLRREMDQLFSSFLGTDETAQSLTAASPSLDLAETDNEIEVQMDAPGMKPEEIDIRLDRDVLTVRGEHEEERKREKVEGAKEERRFHRVERRSGRFTRTVRLPALVQEDKIDAELHDGVLTIRMPKAEESKPHKIPVKG